MTAAEARLAFLAAVQVREAATVAHRIASNACEIARGAMFAAEDAAAGAERVFVAAVLTEGAAAAGPVEP